MKENYKLGMMKYETRPLRVRVPPMAGRLFSLSAFIFSLFLLGCVSPPQVDRDLLSTPPIRSSATVLSVHDGDTFKARVDLCMGVSVTDSFRLNGVDCPELHTAHGKQVRDDMAIKMGPLVQLDILKRDKYGRWLVEVYNQDGENLNDWLISTGGAKPYAGRGLKPFQ